MAAAERRISDQAIPGSDRRRSSTIFKAPSILKSAKDAGNTAELDLSGKGLASKTIEGLEAFTSLEVLRLNENGLAEVPSALGSLAGSLREVYLSNNELASIDHTCLPLLNKLEKLVLSGNKLEDLAAVLSVLEELPPLRELDLRGNPLAETEHYRDKVLDRLTALQVLDGEAVTAEAREAAVAKVRQLAEEAAQPPLLTSRSGKHLLNVKNNTAMMGRLKAMLANVRKAVKSRRILMQPDFVDVDRRKEGCVIEREFIRILDLYSLLPKPKTVDKPSEHSAALTSVSDLAILLSFYGCEPPKRCRSLGRDKRFQEAYYVSYVGFCRDIEPICGGRDMETRERILEEQWNERAPAISECLRRLRRDVKAIKTRMQEEKEAQWRALASASHARPHTEVCVPWKVKATSATKLGAWELLELKRLLKARDPGKTGLVSKEDVLGVVKDMETRGRKLVGQDAWAAGRVESKGELLPELEAIMAHLDAKGTGRLPWRDFVNGVDGDSGLFGRLRWVKLRGSEATSKSKELFKQANALQSTLALGAVTGKAAEEMEAQIKSLSQIATRLQRQATESDDVDETGSVGTAAGHGSSGGIMHQHEPHPHRRSSSAAVVAVGRKDFVKTVDYLPHRRALSSSTATDTAQPIHLRRRSSSSLRDRFGLIPELRDKFAVKQSLKQPGRGPYPTDVKVI